MVSFTCIFSKITKHIPIIFYITFFISLHTLNINASEILNYKTQPHNKNLKTYSVIYYNIKYTTQQHKSRQLSIKLKNSKEEEEKLTQKTGRTNAILMRSRERIKINNTISKSIKIKLIYKNKKNRNNKHQLFGNYNTAFIHHIEGRAPPDKI